MHDHDTSDSLDSDPDHKQETKIRLSEYDPSPSQTQFQFRSTPSHPFSSLPLPDAIVGDLDSLTPASRAWYQARGVSIAHRPSQYATDLQKSIQWVEDWEERTRQATASSSSRDSHQPDPDVVVDPELELVILGGLGGRQDQAAHTYHVLWKLCPALRTFGGYEDPHASDAGEAARGGQVKKRERAWVLGDSSLVWLLPPCGSGSGGVSASTHELSLPGAVLGEACGILPYGVPGSGSGTGADGAHVWTRGLEWDLDPAQPQCLGGFLSTSNHVVYTHGQGRVLLRTDRPVFFSVEVAL